MHYSYLKSTDKVIINYLIYNIFNIKLISIRDALFKSFLTWSKKLPNS